MFTLNGRVVFRICIGNNSIVSSAIWKKHARVSFSKTIKIARVQQFEVFEKLTARETIILLLVNNIHKKFRANNIFICSQSSAIGMCNFKLIK